MNSKPESSDLLSESAKSAFEPAISSPNLVELQHHRALLDTLTNQTVDGRYLIKRRLGEGGMGVVYEVEHIGLHKRMALKVLQPELTTNVEATTRFRTEAIAISSLGHPNIIDVSDFGKLPDGSMYFVMEFLEGESLYELLSREKRLPITRAIAIAAQVCKALQAAHEKGIFHRDIKPENIYLISREGDDGKLQPDFVKLLDFGVAKVSSSVDRATQMGRIVGSPHYMSPEQCAAKTLGPQSDLYSLGVVIFEAVTGTLPFDSDDLVTLISKHVFEPAPMPSERPGCEDLPIAFDSFIGRILAKSPGERFEDARAMRHALHDLLLEIGKVSPSEELVFERTKVQLVSSGNQRIPTTLSHSAIAPVVLTPSTEPGSNANPASSSLANTDVMPSQELVVLPKRSSKLLVSVCITVLVLVLGLWWSQFGSNSIPTNTAPGPASSSAPRPNPTRELAPPPEVPPASVASPTILREPVAEVPQTAPSGSSVIEAPRNPVRNPPLGNVQASNTQASNRPAFTGTTAASKAPPQPTAPPNSSTNIPAQAPRANPPSSSPTTAANPPASPSSSNPPERVRRPSEEDLENPFD